MQPSRKRSQPKEPLRKGRSNPGFLQGLDSCPSEALWEKDGTAYSF